MNRAPRHRCNRRRRNPARSLQRVGDHHDTDADSGDDPRANEHTGGDDRTDRDADGGTRLRFDLSGSWTGQYSGAFSRQLGTLTWTNRARL